MKLLIINIIVLGNSFQYKVKDVDTGIEGNLFTTVKYNQKDTIYVKVN